MTLIFAFPGYEKFAQSVQEKSNCSFGNFTLHEFPDGDSLVTFHTNVKDKDVVVVCGLENPNIKSIPLMFFSKTAKEFGAKSVTLISPYLGYIRQDKRFKPGEAITSKLFAEFISSFIDRLITLDPHLHRYKSLSEIYTIPTISLRSADLIVKWINKNIQNAVLIGPDKESRQWVQDIAKKAHIPFIVLEKIRHGDRDVKISIPDVDKYMKHTPVLVDDIISTARTMIETVKHLHNVGLKSTVCIGIHAIFSDDSYAELKKSGVETIVTTNTILHDTNKIDVTSLFSEAILFEKKV